MSSRDNILKAIRDKKPVRLPLPVDYYPALDQVDLVQTFSDSAIAVGGSVEHFNTVDEAVNRFESSRTVGQRIINCLSPMNGIDPSPIAGAQFEDVHLCLISGEFGVAENAAIWVDCSKLPHRSLPFIAENLVIVLKKDQLVANMHEAYRRLDISNLSFGLFIAGPSKTADIEQSLVIGAHGAKSLIIAIIP